MKKTFLNPFFALMMFVLLFNRHEAQAQLQAQITGNLLKPVSQLFSNNYGSGVGAGVAIKYHTLDNFNFGAGYSYNFLFQKGGAVPGITYNFNRLYAVVEYYFIKASGTPFIALEPGIYFMSVHTSVTGLVSNSYGESAYGIAPVVGYTYEFRENLATTISLRYHYLLQISNNNYQSNTPLVLPYGENVQALEMNAGLIYTFR